MAVQAGHCSGIQGAALTASQLAFDSPLAAPTSRQLLGALGRHRASTTAACSGGGAELEGVACG